MICLRTANALSMRSYITSDILQKKGDRLIYVYNFFAMWTIFVELSEITDKNEEELPLLALSFGNTPDEAPLKNFTSEDAKDGFDVFEDENDFENLDHLDLDKF